jgi:hypothetical protein
MTSCIDDLCNDTDHQCTCCLTATLCPATYLLHRAQSALAACKTYKMLAACVPQQWNVTPTSFTLEHIRRGAFSCCRCLAGDLHCLTSMPSRFKQLCISSTCNEIHSNHTMSIKAGPEHLGMLSMSCCTCSALQSITMAHLLAAAVQHDVATCQRCRVALLVLSCSLWADQLRVPFQQAHLRACPSATSSRTHLAGRSTSVDSNFAEMTTNGDARLKLSAAAGVAAVGFDTCPISFVLRPQALPQVLPLRFRQVAGAAGERPHAGCQTYCAAMQQCA